MSFGFSHRFSVDTFSRRIAPPPLGPMAEAAHAYYARDYDRAERCCLALIEQDARHFEALHLLGVVCLDRKQLADAVGYLTRAVRERPDDARASYHLVTALLGVKLYEQAEAALRRAVALRPDDAGALTNLGDALVGSKRHAEAIDCFHRALTIDAGHAPAHFNLGRSLLALDRLDAAVASFHAALAHAPADTDPDRLADVRGNLGQALVGLGRYDEALATCQAMAGHRPQCQQQSDIAPKRAV